MATQPHTIQKKWYMQCDTHKEGKREKERERNWADKMVFTMGIIQFSMFPLILQRYHTKSDENFQSQKLELNEIK